MSRGAITLAVWKTPLPPGTQRRKVVPKAGGRSPLAVAWNTRGRRSRKPRSGEDRTSTQERFVTVAPFSRYALIMDINKMLSDLRLERDQISEAIVVLERLTI